MPGTCSALAFVGLLPLAEFLDWLCNRTETTPRELLPLLLAAIGLRGRSAAQPNGFTMLTFPFFVMRMKINQTILEWQPPNLHDPHLVSVHRPRAYRRSCHAASAATKYRPGQFLLLRNPSRRRAAVCAQYPGISAWWPSCFLPTTSGCLGAEWLLARLRALRAGRRPRPSLLAIAAYFCAHAASDGLAFQALAEKNLYPRDAVTYIADHHLPPNILNDYTFGGYLIWRLYPAYQVYVDGRADLYGDDFLVNYVATLRRRK